MCKIQDKRICSGLKLTENNNFKIYLSKKRNIAVKVARYTFYEFYFSFPDQTVPDSEGKKWLKHQVIFFFLISKSKDILSNKKAKHNLTKWCELTRSVFLNRQTNLILLAGLFIKTQCFAVLNIFINFYCVFRFKADYIY